MVRALHEAGIEVILDVVYNHTAEGNHLGPDAVASRASTTPPTTGWSTDDQRYYIDYTGTGNSLNVRHPHTLQLIMDSLRYWVTEMHVDGFRFDLAATLAREFYEVDRLSAFFDLVQQDPVVSQVKLIAEPWDVGAGGYQVGNFPPLWTEWNGKYRDTVRDFWRGEPADAGRVRLPAHRLRRPLPGRRPPPVRQHQLRHRHDGFTLRDLVSYNEKHNEANGEDNRDGESHNRSWNCGVEGPTDDPAVLALRARQQRNFLATLLLSQGVPMLLPRRRVGRTQHGNNNAYCQDNELSWVDWDARSTSELLGVHPAADRAAPASTRCSAGAGSSTAGRWRPRRRRPAAGHGLVHPGRPGDDRARTGSTGFGRSVGGVPQRRRHPGPRRSAASASSTTRSCCCFNAHDEPLDFTLPRRASTARSGSWCSTPRTPARWPRPAARPRARSVLTGPEARLAAACCDAA